MRHDIHVHGRHTPIATSRVHALTDEPQWFERGLYIEHFSYLGVSDLVARLARYTQNEVDHSDPALAEKLFYRSVMLIPVEFFGRLVAHRAGKDGRGALLMAAN